MRNITRYSNTEMSKIEAATIIVNHFIDELLARATRHNRVRNYYDIGVIGYSGDDAISLLGDDDRVLQEITRLADSQPQPKTIHLNQRYPDGTLQSVPFNIHPWIEPTAAGASPMYNALIMAKIILKEWCNDPQNNSSHPPIIFHITDGVANDADDFDMGAISDEIKNISKHNGNVMLFNVYLATVGEGDESEEIYPCELTFASGDRNCEFLYNISSQLPSEFETNVSQFLEANSIGPYRAVAFNISPISLLSIISIGTESGNH